MLDVELLKRKILDFLRDQGPALPIKIAKAIDQELVFTSALLGDLLSNKKVHASTMRVGASQIYYVSGQEQKLESFADEYLNGFVKQAYLLLKEKGYIIDAKQEPAMRVALRSIKDFATPFTFKDQLMWRYNFVPKETILEQLVGTSQTVPVTLPKHEEKESLTTTPEPQKVYVPRPPAFGTGRSRSISKSSHTNFPQPLASHLPLNLSRLYML